LHDFIADARKSKPVGRYSMANLAEFAVLPLGMPRSLKCKCFRRLTESSSALRLIAGGGVATADHVGSI
jgi:hypothetical protein